MWNCFESDRHYNLYHGLQKVYKMYVNILFIYHCDIETRSAQKEFQHCSHVLALYIVKAVSHFYFDLRIK